MRFREPDPSPADGRSDDEIMWAVTSDISELGLLFDRHHRALFRFFFRVTGSRSASDDLVQDVFFRILKYRHTYRKGVPFDRWMYRIAINARRDYSRKLKRDDANLAEVVVDVAAPGPVPEEEIAKRQELALLSRALVRLSDDHREVLVLSRFQNLKYDEIGEIVGVNAGAVKVRVYRALRELKGLFFEMTGEKKRDEV